MAAVFVLIAFPLIAFLLMAFLTAFLFASSTVKSLIVFVALCVLVVLYHLSSLGMFRHCCAENCGWFDLMIQGWINNMTMGLYGVQKYFKYRDSKCVIR